MSYQIQLRRDLAANWTSANPTLAQGEQGYETNTGKMKIGDGVTAWVSLPYFLAPAGAITALTGDGTATGPGSAALTLATVNSNVGSFGTASAVPQVTVNAKGLTTAASNVSIQIAESQVTNLVSDLAGKQPVGNYITALTGDVTASGPGSAAATLATVNSNVGSFGSASSVGTFTANGKGLLTAAGSTAIQITESQVTNLVSDLAGKVPTTRNVNTTAPLTGGGALSGDLTLSMPAATTSVNGYLTSADWNTFNGKQNTLSIGAFGSTPNANGLSISSSVLTLQPADATHPGGLSITTQSIAGDKTLLGLTTLLGNSLGNTVSLTKGLFLQNTTASTNVATQQNSPPVVWAGHAWETQVPAQDRIVGWRGYLQANVPPGSGAASSVLNFDYTVGPLSGTWTTALSVGQGVIDLLVPTTRMRQFLATGAGTFNSSVTMNNTLTSYGAAFMNNQLSVAGVLNLNGSMAVNSNLTGAYISFDHTAGTLAIGGAPGGVNGVVQGYSSNVYSVTPPSTVSASLVQVQDAPVPGGVAVQATPQMNRATTFTMVPVFDAAGPYTAAALGTVYSSKIWSGNSGQYSAANADASFIDDGSIITAGDQFDIQYDWVQGTSTITPDNFIIQLLIASISTGYVNTGNVVTYTDTTGSYPDTAPSSFYNDYVATGVVRNYTDYSRTPSPDGSFYYSQTPNTYSMTDDNSGNPYQVFHTFAQANVRVLGDPSGTGTGFGFFTGVTNFFTENSGSWTGVVTVTPDYTGIAYLSNGTNLNATFDAYNITSILGVPTYSAPTSGVVTDPNDGNYYVFNITTGGHTSPYKIIKDTAVGLSLSAGTTYYQVNNAASWTAGTVVTPNSYYLPAVVGQAGNAAASPMANYAAASQSVDRLPFVNSDGTIQSGVDKNGAFRPPQITDSTAENGTMYYSTTQNKLCFKDLSGTVHTLY